MTDLVQKLVGALGRLLDSDPEGAIATASEDDLTMAANDMGADPVIREQAAAVLQARAALSEAKAGGWQPIETAPVGREMFVVIGVTSGNGFTGGRPYTSDPYCVWQPEKGEFSRWPHNWAPTHWQPLPAPPAQRGEG